MEKQVLISKNGGVGTLTLNRTKRHNSLVPEFLQDILSCFDKLSSDHQVQVIIIQANGKTFSTGGDVASFLAHKESLTAYSESVVGTLNELIMAIIECPKPVITAVHGMVTGGSIGLVLAADIVLVSSRASFTPYYATVGYSPDGGWSALLPSIIGSKRTAHVLMTDSTISAQQAFEWGIASKVVHHEDIRSEAIDLAHQLTKQNFGTLVHTKKLLSSKDGIQQALIAEHDAFIRQINTEEALYGMKSFLNSLQ
jgi:2-(1,2-epoxy-1,2-dihydrophenyl)acetyl-CoA isomerase